LALQDNRTADFNTAIGYSALSSNETGDRNTAIGFGAGTFNTTGNNNTFVGSGTGTTSVIDNATALGNGATVNASNKVRIGDSNVTVIEGQVAWSNPSDKRLKENIVYTPRIGLDFINRLQTVSYNYIADKSKTRYDGFIAQDVETVMKELGVPFSGLKKADDGTYSLAYSDFVMPLVNAVKELNRQQEEQQQTMERLEKQNELLLQALADLKEVKTELTKLKAENNLHNSAKK
jgi:hypothetical protein